MSNWQIALLITSIIMVGIGAFLIWGPNARVHANRSKKNWRGWLSIGDYEYGRAGFESQLEVSWRRTGPGFKLHLGDRGSDTPLDIMIGLWLVTFYIGFNWTGLGSFCEKVGRGHKRNISLRAYAGQLWWELWYDDDMGYDDHHRCDGWRKPKVWPWSRGRIKYRSWMCLRHGNIHINPLDAIWGERRYHYAVLEEDTLLIEINEFEGDEYMVDFKVQMCELYRDRGPWFARRIKFHGFSCDWDVEEGIPIQNHDWKGDNVYSSSFAIDDPIDWRMDADNALKAWVVKQRKRNHYRHISQKFEQIGRSMIQVGEAAAQAAQIMQEFGRSVEDMKPVILPDEGVVITPLGDVDIIEGDEIKSKYTLEELAQQAINRDSMRDE